MPTIMLMIIPAHLGMFATQNKTSLKKKKKKKKKLTSQWETRDTKVSSKQHNKVQHCLGCISFQLALMVRVSYSYKFWHKLRKHERDAKRELLPC